MGIAIVDDQGQERTQIKKQLEEQLFQNDIRTDLLEFENAETFLQAAQTKLFAIAFLDIYMEGTSSIMAARKLRQSDSNCLLVFSQP